MTENMNAWHRHQEALTFLRQQTSLTLGLSGFSARSLRVCVKAVRTIFSQKYAFLCTSMMKYPLYCLLNMSIFIVVKGIGRGLTKKIDSSHILICDGPGSHGSKMPWMSVYKSKLAKLEVFP